MSPHSLSRAVFPDEKQVQQAAKAVRQLAAFRLKQSEISRIELVCDEDRREMLALPTMSLGLLEDILGELALGNAVKVVAIHAELTTQEAANLLNVSRLLSCTENCPTFPTNLQRNLTHVSSTIPPVSSAGDRSDQRGFTWHHSTLAPT